MATPHIEWEKPWNSKTEDQRKWIKEDFETSDEDDADADVLFADYALEGYEGSAFVLFKSKKDGNLYTVEASHCSCMGLEGQWSPVKTTLQAELLRLNNGGRISYDDTLTEKYRQFINNLNSEI